VLIETDFISTPAREKMLKNREFQNRFTQTVAGTVAAYLAGRQPRDAAGQTKGAKRETLQPDQAVEEKQNSTPPPGADTSGKAGDAAPERQTPPARAAADASPLLAPEGGKYRVVKKSDTEYVLVPLDQAQTPSPRQAGVQTRPSPQPASVAPAKVQATTKPETAAPVTLVISHVVKKGESLASIAQKYQVPFKELCRQNNLPFTTKVEAGVKLKIVKQKYQQR
jgi:LysM repeat protein